MSTHRVTLRQREWQEAVGAGVLAAIVSTCILVTSLFAQAPAPPEQEYTGPPRTHLLGMAIIEQQGRGALVQEVEPLSPAAKAGVRDGDLLLRVAGAKTTPYDDFLKILRDKIEKSTKGDPVPIVAMRGGEQIELSLTERVGADERKEEVQELAAEYSANKADEELYEQAAEPEGGESLEELLSGGRQPAAPSASLGDAPPAPPVAGYANQDDIDYYFGDGGYYGSALTSAQQSELDRLLRMSDRNGLTSAQQKRLDELSDLEMSLFDRLDPLDDSSRAELRQLLARRQGGDQLASDDRARLRQLIGRELNRDGNLREQRESLEQLSRQRDLNSREQMRLDLLKELGPDARERVSANSLQSLRDLVGGSGPVLPPDQLARLQSLADNPERLTPAERSELQQLRFQAESQLARRLRGEFQNAQQMLQNGAQFTPEQQARYQMLERNLGRFSAGGGRTMPVPPRAASAAAAAAQPVAPSAAPSQGSGSGIGLGNQGGPSQQGSGIGTADGPGSGSAPSGGVVGSGGGQQ